jgi:hypothetical protein
MLRVHRSRGAASGVLLMLLGAWGGLAPFVGPYAHFAYLPDSAWRWTGARGWLEVLPGAITLVAGLIMVLTRLRLLALLAALLAALSGAWFAVGGVLAPLWPATSSLGRPTGAPVARALEQIGFFSGAGVVIVATASIAMGRLAMISDKDMRDNAGGSAPSGARGNPPANTASPQASTAARAAASAGQASTSVTASPGLASMSPPTASVPMTPDKAGSSMTSTGTPSTGSVSISADEISSADTITSKTRQGHSGKGGWRLAGRATMPRSEPDDPSAEP